MRRISIIGGSGTGKTTLANNLSKELKIPVYHLDGLNYEPNWVQVDNAKRDKKINEIIQKDKWIIDGTYTSTLRDRINNSDLIIFLNFSTFSRLFGVFKRYFKYGKKDREEIPGCEEKIDLEFLKFVINWGKNKRKFILNELSRADKNKEVFIFKNRISLNRWYEKEFNKKIKY